MTDVLIIGAGIAGLAAAQTLTQQGYTVRLLEKSRGVGGRLATRRVGETVVDHGAQYFTMRSPEFTQFLAPLLASGQVIPWLEEIPTLTTQGIIAAPEDYRYPRYACPSGMNIIAKLLATGLSIDLQTRAISLEPDPSGWQIHTEQGTTYTARAVLLTPPPTQSQAILGSWAQQLPELEAVAFHSCWAVFAEYQQHFALPKGLRWVEDPVIAWSAVDSSKRPEAKNTVLVFHSQPTFAQIQAAAEPATVIQLVLAQASQALGLDLTLPLWSQAHFWRYAQPITPFTQAWLGNNQPAPLAIAGCWLAGGRVEGAFLSGQRAAQGLAEWL